MRTHHRLLLVVSLAGLSACAGLVRYLVHQRDAIRAPHKVHAEAEVDCATCHETIFDSTHLKTVDLPKEKVCFGCHKEQKESGDCAFCHTLPDKPASYPPRVRHLVMNHQEHIERVKEDCTVCHQELPNPTWTKGLSPSMDSCLKCHQKDWDEGNCALCHEDLTRYDLKPVAAYSHAPGFGTNHRMAARAQPESCSTCHQQSFCSDCHEKTQAPRVELQLPERVDRFFVHRNDFLSRHAVEAASDESTCLRCHGVDSCQSCHQKNGVVPGAPKGLNPHPAGFGQGKAHGQAARQDIVSCAACHDQGAASNCVSCHRTGGVGGNPHPQSWLLHHDVQEISGNAMCQACHL